MKSKGNPSSDFSVYPFTSNNGYTKKSGPEAFLLFKIVNRTADMLECSSFSPRPFIEQEAKQNSYKSILQTIMQEKQNPPVHKPVSDEQILKVTKEIVVKFIEVGRVTPTSFNDTFTQVFNTVKKNVKDS